MVERNIVTLRTGRGMTQVELAEQLGISRQALSNYETGKREPDIKALMALADLFGITIDALVGRKTTGYSVGITELQ